MRRSLALLLALLLVLAAVPTPVLGVGLCSVYRTWQTGDSLTAADLNTSFTTVGVTNAVPSCIDDHSPDVTTMRATTDPYPSAVESQATTIAGELERLRYVIKKITGWSQWYAHSESLALVPRGHIDGFVLSNNVADATNDIDIAAGQATDSTGAQILALSSGLTKRLDATWTVGTNQGMRDGGTIADASYHLYAIKRVDTGVVDVLASLNNDATATITMTIASPGVVTWTDHGLQAGSSIIFTTTGALPTGVTAGTRYYVIATGLTTSAFQFSASEGGAAVNTSGTQSGTHTGTAGPILPADYTLKRMIGSIKRASAALLTFKQHQDRVCWTDLTAPAIDYDSGLNPGTSALTATLTVPVGLRMNTLVNVRLTADASTAAILLTDLAQTDVAPAINTTLGSTIGPTNLTGGATAQVRTSPAAQVRVRLSASGAATNAFVKSVCWDHPRGRNN